ncbi:cupin domain-containing protein [Massilia sp. YIM B02769]|uniref:(R)-mandelonitrile lyase n=1 Tax=Massilia sp. YIM B02769 TaxID=3050129 RepID=UPI0025B70EB9|nr:cupin domain-containing protein [Massilia sp. YIM B02769]
MNKRAMIMTMLLAACGLAHAAGENGAREQTIFRAGAAPSSNGPAANFDGKVHVDPLFPAGAQGSFSAATVNFEPGSRSAWHTHPAGQYLIVTKGTGWTQAEGGPVEELHAGDAVWCPPGVKHWHGATPTTAMSHIALTATRDGKNVEWLEKVSAQQYRR